jgi:hypothetical protein
LPEKISEESRRRLFQIIQTVWAAWGNLGFFSHAAQKHWTLWKNPDKKISGCLKKIVQLRYFRLLDNSKHIKKVDFFSFNLQKNLRKCFQGA